MQHMKKVHSLDYSARSGAGRNGPGLMHSVSIVVELANEVYLSGEAGELQLERGHFEPDKSPIASIEDQQQQHKSGGKQMEWQTNQVDDKKTADKNGDSSASDDDDEAEEEEEECLDSGLARRVVIVDEADKIFLGRAQSASPRFSGADQQQQQQTTSDLAAGDQCDAAGRQTPERGRPTCPQGQLQDQLASFGGATNSPACAHERPASAAGESGARQPRRGSALATEPERGHEPWRSSGPRQQLYSLCGSSELAERGALSRLGMRRNTHHHVNFDPAPASPTAGRRRQQQRATFAGQLSVDNQGASKSRPAAAALAHFQAQQQSSPIARGPSATNPLRQKLIGHSSAATATPGALLKQQQPGFSQQHRRQSLQINLLAHGAINQSSKSLTEEELRGEREFNEQVRQIAKSPDLLSNPFHLRASTGSSAGQQQQHRQEPAPGHQRRQSTAEYSTATSSSLSKSSIAPPQQQRRRVSFSSIDPIVVSGTPATTFAAPPQQQQQQPARANTILAAHRPARQHQQRASISGSLLFDANQPARSGSPGRQSPPEQADTSSSCSQLQSLAGREHQLGASSSSSERTASKTILKHQRYSLATTSHAQQQQQRPEATPERRRQQVDDDENSKFLEKIMSSLEMNEKLRKDLTGDERADATEAAGESAPVNRRLASLELKDKPEVDNRTATNRGQAQQQQPRRREIISSISTTTPPPASATATTMTTDSGCPLITRRHQSIGGDKDESKVQSIMANARLRQEEFARLLEEHEQIVNEINRFENKISNTSQINLRQQKQAENIGDSNNSNTKQLNEDKITCIMLGIAFKRLGDKQVSAPEAARATDRRSLYVIPWK